MLKPVLPQPRTIRSSPASFSPISSVSGRHIFIAKHMENTELHAQEVITLTYSFDLCILVLVFTFICNSELSLTS